MQPGGHFGVADDLGAVHGDGRKGLLGTADRLAGIVGGGGDRFDDRSQWRLGVYTELAVQHAAAVGEVVFQLNGQGVKAIAQGRCGGKDGAAHR